VKTYKVIAILLGLMLVFVVCSTVFAEDKKPQDTYVLKGAPMGGVKFDHKAHVAAADKKCETCHHASKPEKPSKSAQEACTDCHTTPAVAPMKTKKQAAFHDPTAKKGTCMDCHTKAVAAGKKAPTKCTDCHKKENT
jgi:hypothetical protein